MLFKRTLQREADLTNRTITIEDAAPPWKYKVVVYTVKIPTTPPTVSPSFGAGPEVQHFPFGDQHHAIQCAEQKVTDSLANGYTLLPSHPPSQAE
jgi:hypothetical protein